MIRPARTNIKICNIPVSVSNLWDASAWGIWLWKLDPYRSAFPSSHAKVNIECGHMLCSIEKLEEKTLVWKEQNSFMEQRVYVCSDGEILWAFISSVKREIMLLYSVNQDWNKITLLQDTTNSIGQVAFEHLTLLLPGVLLRQQVLSFHGVLMEYNGHGIILSASSGTGKTTHARLWRDYKNALIINGDRAVCGWQNDTWMGFGFPWSGSSGEQVNRNVPIRALVVLERGEKNEVRRISGLESFGAIWPHVLYPAWNREMVGDAMDMVNDFISRVPVYLLKCRPDEESVEVLYRAVWET